jgi:hypothetical protein
MGWKDSLKNSISQGADSKLQEHMPAIRQLFQEKVAPEVRAHLSDPEKFLSSSKVVYSLLPMPVRLMVKEDAFIAFCQEHKDQLLV